jgi:hypothetical protein
MQGLADDGGELHAWHSALDQVCPQGLGCLAKQLMSPRFPIVAVLFLGAS